MDLYRPRFATVAYQTLRLIVPLIAITTNSFAQRRPIGPPNRQIILETTYKNVPFDTSSPTWAKDRVKGETMFSMDTTKPPFEWSQVLDPNDEYDRDFIGLSGWVVSPEESETDVPFLHPFGGVDTEFYTVPDTAYRYLAAPTDDDLYVRALQKAKQRGFNVENILGCETDIGLVPPIYRPVDGDRVAMWGRWIVDAGHPDFHTEIHPPALLVAARATPAGSTEKTQITVISRPYLVSQTFSDGERLRNHLLEEVNKLKIGLSTRLEAHPVIMKKPFVGNHEMSFVVRPPTPRHNSLDRLMVDFHFTVRTGVTVQAADAGDSVVVYVTMNDANYKPPALPDKHTIAIKRSELKKMNPDAGTAYDVAIFASILTPGNTLAPIFELQGIETDRYDDPQPVLGATTSEDVRLLKGDTPVTVNDDQPFPIAGSLSLTWKRGPNVRPPTIGRDPTIKR